MRKSTLTTILISLIAGMVAALVVAASPAAADDFDLVAEIEPMVPGDPVVIDDFLAPPSLAFELRVDCEGGLPPVTLWMKNTGATDVTVEVYDYAGPDGMVLDAGSETVVELDFDAYEMDVAIARVYAKDGEAYRFVSAEPDIGGALLVERTEPGPLLCPNEPGS